MTICIGLLASDGIVIAADSEEGDSYLKRSQEKIFPWMGNVSSGPNAKPPESACVLTGAGDAGMIDAFTHKALKGLHAGMMEGELLDYFENEIRDFYERHMFPRVNPPAFQMLIGTFSRVSTAIFVTYGSTIRRALPYAAVGAGSNFAMSQIAELNKILDLKHTEVLAAYIIAATKERVEGCGKNTSVVSLHNASVLPGDPAKLAPPEWPLTVVSPNQIRQWEESFSAKWAPRQMTLIEELIEEELA